MIEELIADIQLIEGLSGTREATQHLLTFLFEALESQDWVSLNSLFSCPATLSLNYLHLICLVNVTAGSRSHLSLYSDFLEKVQMVCRPQMTDRNYRLTFGS